MTETIVREMHRILERAGIEVVAVVIPFWKTLSPEWPSFAEALEAGAEADHATRTVESLLRSLEVPVVSVRERIERGEMQPGDYFISSLDEHLNQFGHQMVSHWILEELARQKLTESPVASPEFQGGNLPRRFLPPGLAARGLTTAAAESRPWEGLLGVGSETLLAFQTPQERPLELYFRLRNPLPSQRVRLLFNGRLLPDGQRSMAEGEKWQLRTVVQTRAGRNEVRFEYADHSGARRSCFPRERRPIAVRFDELSLEFEPYSLLREAVCSAVRGLLPPGARVLAVSDGDDELLALLRPGAAHFPQAPGGGYAGHYPADGDTAVSHLLELREAGADYLLFPRPSLWWLDHHGSLARHLEEQAELVFERPELGRLYRLESPQPGTSRK